MKYYWALLGIVTVVSLAQIATGTRSIELTVFLFSLVFMALTVEMGAKDNGRGWVITKIEGLEMVLNDVSSNLITPSLRKKREEIIEWLNKF